MYVINTNFDEEVCFLAVEITQDFDEILSALLSNTVYMASTHSTYSLVRRETPLSE